MNVDIQELSAEVEDVVTREKRKPNAQGQGASAERMTQMMRRLNERDQWMRERVQA
ncbi:MAG: hypothetical protein WA790_01420 [Sulfitobacter sp.]